MTSENALAAIENGDLDALTASFIATAFAAIRKNDENALTAALDAGIDPNARDGDGRTLLMEAVYRNQLNMVDVLLSRGANVHQKDRYGCTALHFAANNHTALHFAANESNSDVFPAIFSAAGPRAMNFPNCHGLTPLHYLACNGSAEQMAFALSHPGIDVSIRNNCGHAPSDDSIKTYGDEEARWQPIRYTWIKLLKLVSFF